jgi:hypothetical protein
MYVIFENVKYTLFPAKYSGISYLTGKKFEKNTNIYWNTQYKRGFTEDEYEEYKANDVKTLSKLPDNFTDPPVVQTLKCETCTSAILSNVFKNTEWTYDDSSSRRRAMQIFKKYYGIDLQAHSGLYMNINGAFQKFTDGKYCEDLFAIQGDELIFVEVERTRHDDLFESNENPIHILVSKYWKYFHDGNKHHKHYMCFINEDKKKAAVISGSDIKFNRGKYVQISDSNGRVHECYEIPKQFVKIFDLDKSVEALIDSCLISY